jgi:hypothetical protein
VTSIDDLHRLLMAIPAEQPFDLTILRDDMLQTASVPAR